MHNMDFNLLCIICRSASPAQFIVQPVDTQLGIQAVHAQSGVHPTMYNLQVGLSWTIWSSVCLCTIWSSMGWCTFWNSAYCVYNLHISLSYTIWSSTCSCPVFWLRLFMHNLEFNLLCTICRSVSCAQFAVQHIHAQSGVQPTMYNLQAILSCTVWRSACSCTIRSSACSCTVWCSTYCVQSAGQSLVHNLQFSIFMHSLEFNLLCTICRPASHAQFGGQHVHAQLGVQPVHARSGVQPTVYNLQASLLCTICSSAYSCTIWSSTYYVQSAGQPLVHSLEISMFMHN